MAGRQSPVNAKPSPHHAPVRSIRTALIVIGVAALLVGTLVYVVARPPERIYFMQKIGQHLSLYGKDVDIFGPWAKSLPTFLHVFGFSLITAGLVGGGRITNVLICTGWAGVNVLFELGQKYKDQTISWVPGWFKHIPFLENSVPYFRNGSFDPNDLMAALSGAVLALIMIGVLGMATPKTT